MTTKELSRHQTRWVEKLAIFDFIIQHHPGRINPTDAPSCCPDYQPQPEENIGADTLLPTLQRKLQHSLSQMPNWQSESLDAVFILTTSLACQWEPSSIPMHVDTSNSCNCSDRQCTDENHTNGVTGNLDILVPWLMIQAAMQIKTAYITEPSESMVDLLHTVQHKDKNASKLLSTLVSGARSMLSDLSWSISNDGLLWYNNHIYVP